MKVKQYERYIDVPKEYRFDLEAILEGKPLQWWIDKLTSIVNQRLALQKIKYDNIDNFIDDLLAKEQQTIVYYKIDAYLKNKLAVDLVNYELKAELESFQNLWKGMLEKFGSEDAEFELHKDKIAEFMKDKRLKFYLYQYKRQKLKNQHYLGREIEEYLLKTQLAQPNYLDLFKTLTTSELHFEDIKFANEKLPLNHNNKMHYFKSDDLKVRKQAYYNYWNGYLEHKETLTNFLKAHFKKKMIDAKTRNFKYPIECFTYLDGVTQPIIEKLFHKVKQNREIFNKFQEINEELYQTKFNQSRKVYDFNYEIINQKFDIDLETAQQICLAALEPLGEQYLKKVSEALYQNWIDYLPVKNKTLGGYSVLNSFQINKKYILMNFKNELRTTETLIHELGHSMHSYYASLNQDLFNSEYPILLAEVASIFNELLLYDYLFSNVKNMEQEFYLTNRLLNNFSSTILKQTEWANYEYNLYEAMWNNQKFDCFTEYHKNHIEYTKEVEFNEIDNVGAIYVPHYYYDFYMYKYALGQIIALYIFNEYKKYGPNYLQTYINEFLSKSGTDFPLNVLKNIGVDLLDDKLYDNAFNYINELQNKYTHLSNKILNKG
ncbi:M3 family metallopeptidase [Mycoplasma hafezii]|uniref:M3 family metallopeptidase n=1 Tax=Mycoplasma hafezii TaxID=525886 RepID=UPI003CEE7EA7